ncbi:malonyl-CoA decarboxylase [Globomyces pollinis-pini]|nr:malonyl-CoA decarboxylase [Globomyces pollinis-pini]
MKDVLTPAYESLFSRISQLPGGLFFLIRLRADTNYLIKSPYIQAHERFQLQTISESLKSKFQEWFALNKVELQRITWETPAVTLEKILNYEAVHSIASWLALKRRLGVGRFCFAFLHSSIPHEPLTFVQVATMDTIPRHISAILDDPSPTYSGAKVAIFYSITSAQKGLTGVDLGNFLIKRVVRKIQSEMPSVETFVTLSPIPGFRRWLNLALNNQENLLLSDEIKSIEKLSPCDKHSINENLKKWFYMDKLYSPEVENVLQPILLRLCAHYILHEKRRGFALDPVTNFHVRNGAYIQQLNWKGDISEKGFEQSFGIMINYNYKLHDIEENNQKYLLDGTIPILQPVSDTIKWAVDNQDLRTSNKL